MYFKITDKGCFVSNLFSDLFHQNYFFLLRYIKTPLFAFIIYLYDIYDFLILSQLTILGALAPILDCEHPEDKNLVGVTIVSYEVSNMGLHSMRC